MKLDDAIVIALYFLFNGSLLQQKPNADAFVEANKVIEQRVREILDRINEEGFEG